MREIKFRAWFKETEEMKNIAMSNLYREGKSTWLHLSAQPMGSYRLVELMQYTGLKDKNGKDIYEGDILTDFGDAGPLYVEFSTEHAGFVFMDKFDNGPPSYTPKEISYEYFEIIGNIYENPELLVNEGGA